MKQIKVLLIIVLYIQIINGQCVDLKFGCDTIMTNNHLSNYTEYYKQKSYKDAYQPWKWLIMNAPKRTKNLYIHGPKILRGLIEESSDLRREKLIDTLLFVYDSRNIHFPGKEGYVLALKGKDMYKYRANTIEELNACRSVLEESFEIDGLKSTATTITYYFNASLKLFQKEQLDKQDLMTLFSDVSEVVDYREAILSQEIFDVKSDSTKVLSSKEKKALSKLESELARIEKAKNSVNKNFEKIITSCDQLIGLYEGFDRFEIKQEWNKRKEVYDKTYTAFKSSGDSDKDLKWLNKTAEIFIKKECVESEFYLKVATLLHEMNPTAESAFKMGKRKYAKKKYKEAITYFESAFDETQNGLDYYNPLTSAKYAYYTAVAYAANGSYSKARSFAIRAANLRKNWGDPYILIGKLYANTASKCGSDPAAKKAGYWAAIEKFQLARSIDNNCRSEANKLIGDYKNRVPTSSMLADNNYSGKNYKIQCWYTETVRVKQSTDIK